MIHRVVYPKLVLLLHTVALAIAPRTHTVHEQPRQGFQSYGGGCVCVCVRAPELCVAWGLASTRTRQVAARFDHEACLSYVSQRLYTCSHTHSGPHSTGEHESQLG